MDEFNVAQLKEKNGHKYGTSPYQTKTPKPWGYEYNFCAADEPYASKLLHIEAGKQISLQIHDEKQETQILIAGECTLVIEDKDGNIQEVPMVAFHGYTNYPGQQHRLRAVTDCDVMEASTPETGNTIRVSDDYARPTETEEMRKDPNRGWSG